MSVRAVFIRRDTQYRQVSTCSQYSDFSHN